MVVIEGISIHIFSDSGLAPEYPDPIGVKTPKLNRYIEAKAGTGFEVQVQCGTQLFKEVEGAVCTILVDGKAVDRVLLREVEGGSSIVFNPHRKVIPGEFKAVHCDYLFTQAAGCKLGVLDLNSFMANGFQVRA